ncbi:MAG: tRNA guanosine(34) transglycosylase Tgt [Alphaproteobacteria bacterium]
MADKADYTGFNFEITKTLAGSKARLGILTTPHGVVQTPNFIFCATKAAAKIATPTQLRAENTEFILSNTYHLMLQPGADIVHKLGGLQKMTGWNGPMLTDSGGFQIFSLGHGGVAEEIKGKGGAMTKRSLLNITEEGATFKSYMDGSIKTLTPESAIDVQRKLGADIILVLDECTPFHVDKAYTERSMEMTHRWGKRSLAEFIRTQDAPPNGKPQALYGIVQGGVYEDLRRIAAETVSAEDYFGIAVGGSLGSTREQMYDVVAMTMKHMIPTRPVHLLGIGGVRDIWENVQQGIDTFDCVSPTRIARHGAALVKKHPKERINLLNAKYRESTDPIDPDCQCSTCQNFSTGYIHHLFKAKETLAMQLVVLHNIRFMNDLLESVRKGIREDCFEEEKAKWLP